MSRTRPQQRALASGRRTRNLGGIPLTRTPRSMSDDEAFLLIVSSFVLLGTWFGWYTQAATVGVRDLPREGRPLLRAIPIVCIALLWLVLRTVASYDVVDDARYLLLYTILGLAWLGVAIRFAAFAGVSMRDDVLERRNGAAAIALGGAMLGITLAFAGGNIGDGPGWWVVVFSAFLSTGALFVSWLLLDALTGVSDSVTVERDRASGFRLAGFLTAGGIVFGRAVAGDWVSTAATVRDFLAYASPMLVLLLLAAAIERGTRPTAERPHPPAASHGVMPALLYVLLALGHLALVGLGN